MDILNLPGFKVLKTEENPYDYRITAELTEKPGCCPHCGSIPKLYLHGSRDQLVRDTNIHGKRVGILYLRKRYKCRECGSTFYESTSAIDKKARFTARLVEYIEQQSLRRPFLSIAEEIGISHTIVRKIFNEFADRKASETHLITPRVLGIDEIHVSKNPRGILCNIEENTIVEMLPNRNKETIITALRKLDSSKVEIVVIDMWKPYRDAITQALPGTTVVIDKFHVLRMASDAMEKARKAIHNNIPDKQRRQLKRDRFMLLKRAKELTVQEQLSMDYGLARFQL